MTGRLKQLDTSFEPAMEAGTRGVVLIALAAAAVACLFYQVLALNHRYPLDYGEAPLIDQAMRLTRGESIYRADISTPPYTISNYPPLYVVSLVPFVTLFGPSFFAGRFISVVCAWASAIFIGLIVHQATQDRVAAFIGGGIFLAFPFVVMWSSLARIDLLALALSLGGLCVLTRQPMGNPERTFSRRLIAGAALLVAAIYTRQSYALAAPLAAFVWMLAHEEFKRAFALAALVGGACGVLFLALNALTGGGFYFNIVTANINDWAAERMMRNLNRFTATATILCLFGLLSMALGGRRNALWPMSTPYLIGAFVFFLTIGKVGSNVNYMLELCAALGLAVGAVIAWMRGATVVTTHEAIALAHDIKAKAGPKPPPPWVRVVLMALLVIQVISMIGDTSQRELPDLQARRGAAEDLAKLERIVAETKGSVLADEYMGMLTLQGRPLTMQPFEVTQLANAGLWNEAPLLQAIDAKQYPLILIHYFPQFAVYKERWSPAMLDAINRSYRLTASLADTGVYEPIGSNDTASALKTPERCEGAPWRLPSDASIGIKWRGEGVLHFYGRGSPGKVPVHAVADGLLTRFDLRPEAADFLAIQHEDLLNPGRKIWSLYGEMGTASGKESFIVPEFRSGSKGVPVKAGQVIGYQGNWSGEPMPMWLHVVFGLVKETDSGDLPTDATDSWIDPSRYLGLAIQSPSPNGNMQLLKCIR